MPPGQRAIEGFPRFGAHFGKPPPDVPHDPKIEVTGAVTEPQVVRVADLAAMPRRELVADFHCVSGWTATDVRWEGVAFTRIYRTVIVPALRPGVEVTHFVFEGLDGYRSIVEADDALDEDVLLADHLDGRPLNGDHGAPVRLVSPNQYGFISTKHLSRIEVHTAAPRARYHRSFFIQLGLDLVKPHRRARVWREERHRYLPAWIVRPLYRRVIGPIRTASGRGGAR